MDATANVTSARAGILERSDVVMLSLGAGLTALAAAAHYAGLNSILSFVLSGGAIAVLAALVGRAVDQVGERLGPGATGVLQSALGNLPELFICLFALREGLVTVVQAAIIGSILSNVLLVLGVSFMVGGVKHGVQKFSSERARTLATLMLLAVTAMLIPSIASYVHSPAAAHVGTLSVVVSIVLIVLFALSVPSSIRRSEAESSVGRHDIGEVARWPMWLSITVLAATGLLAAVVSDWFVDALTPAMNSLHISEAFAGLVIIAIAGNAVENVVGIQLAHKNEPDFALSVILNSPMQIALVLAPLVVLLSYVIGGSVFTLVFSPMLVTSVVASIALTAFVVYDGESIWLEGAALVALYVLIAASFWWG